MFPSVGGAWGNSTMKVHESAHGQGTVLDLFGHQSGLFVALSESPHPVSSRQNTRIAAFMAMPLTLRRANDMPCAEGSELEQLLWIVDQYPAPGRFIRRPAAEQVEQLDRTYLVGE